MEFVTVISKISILVIPVRIKPKQKRQTVLNISTVPHVKKSTGWTNCDTAGFEKKQRLGEERNRRREEDGL